ncbi:MAG: 16S rRNA (cytidine(1402)-2'-O)-methyltransferase [Alphaproteobacteria bacterium]|nr:16S rRNA (cytidine(1402)-2'-O)-methyltransferase [Alphaproteobacteria bacterium]
MHDDDLKKNVVKSGLYLIATPIGNLGDISFRAIEILKQMDYIYCEDTRVTQTLLSFYDIKKTLSTYHDHNADRTRAHIIAQIEEGKKIALVSDAGMPLVSDPGYKLVKETKAKNLYVTIIPGASAPLTALALSTLPPNQFYFGGFFPDKQEKQKKLLLSLAHLEATLIFFEAPHRIKETIQIIHDQIGDRLMVVARELTKKFEEIIVEKASILLERYAVTPPRGECVLLIEGFQQETKLIDDCDDEILALLKDHKIKEVAEIISTLYKFPKKEVYARALLLTQKQKLSEED